jgi:hypothetical protein
VFATDKIVILSGGIVIGNLFAPFFMAADDVVIDGDCVFSGTTGNVQSELDAFIADHGGLSGAASERIAAYAAPGAPQSREQPGSGR